MKRIVGFQNKGGMVFNILIYYIAKNNIYIKSVLDARQKNNYYLI